MHCWVDGDDGNDDPEQEVDGDSGLVHRAALTGKEPILDNRHGYRREVHAKRRSNEYCAPKPGISFLNLGQAVFGPGVRKVDEEDEAKYKKQDGASEGDVIAPEHKELVWDKERKNDESQPRNYLWPPISVLDGGSRTLGARDSEKEPSKDQVK